MFSRYFTIILIFTATGLPAQDKKKRLEQVMKTWHSYNMFDGAVLVAENGKVVYKGAFGMANREWSIPNTTNTKFMIGSISKPLTAFLTLLQIQKGLIAPDKPLSAYLPEFKDKPAGRVSIAQLLNHTSGMPNYDIMQDFFPRISRRYFERHEYLEIYR